jgi:dual specificity tyrosine-phosphorylation-regulated kinase 2/3/4
MDMWSMALIVVEMLIGKPLFAGDDELEQLILIAEVVGMPPAAMVERSNRKREFFDDGKFKGKKWKNHKPGGTPLDSIVKGDPLLVDFVTKCLSWEQSERMTPAEGLAHPFITVKEVTVQKKQNHPLGILPHISV